MEDGRRATKHFRKELQTQLLNPNINPSHVLVITETRCYKPATGPSPEDGYLNVTETRVLNSWDENSGKVLLIADKPDGRYLQHGIAIGFYRAEDYAKIESKSK